MISAKVVFFPAFGNLAIEDPLPPTRLPHHGPDRHPHRGAARRAGAHRGVRGAAAGIRRRTPGGAHEMYGGARGILVQ